MPSSKRSTDPDHQSFEQLVGVTLQRWRGVNKRGSSAAPPDGELRDAVNIRPVQDGYVSRSGLSKLNLTDIGTIEGLFEAGDRGVTVPYDIPGFTPLTSPPCTPYAAPALFIGLGGAQASPAGFWRWDGTTLTQFPASLNGAVNAIIHISSCLVTITNRYTGPGPAFAAMNPELRKISPDGGSAPVTWAMGVTPANLDVVHSMAYLPSDLGTDRLIYTIFGGAAIHGIVSTPDLVTYSVEFIAPLTGDQRTFLVRDPLSGLVYVLAPTTTPFSYGMYERNAGGSVYTGITRNAPQVSAVRCLFASANGTKLIGGYGGGAGNTQVLLMYPGLSVVGAWEQVLDTGVNGQGVTAVNEIAPGSYVFSYQGAGPTAQLDVGSVSGSIFSSNHIFNFTTAFPADSINLIASLVPYAGSMYALAKRVPPPSERTYLYKSAGTNLASWSKIGEVSDSTGAGSVTDVGNMHMVVL